MMSENGSPYSMSLQQWMRDLPEPIKNVPFIYIAIPGSHDSMTYRITRSSGVAPDAEPIVKRLYPLFRGTILRWTITQALDAMQQLLIGIRYLDLRLATKNGTDSFYYTHGLYAGEITEPLLQVKEFVETHPGEVVILDCQHFYAFTAHDHQRLIRYLLGLFGPKLVPRQESLQHVTLNSMARLGQQIIVVYRHSSVYSTSEFWQTQSLPSPWPRQDSPSGLTRFLTGLKRHPGAGFVHQAVMTPTPAFIFFRLSSSIREQCAKPVKDKVLPVLSEFSPGPPLEATAQATINVAIADFVELDDAIFSKTIIQLNFKLLQNGVTYQNGG